MHEENATESTEAVEDSGVAEAVEEGRQAAQTDPGDFDARFRSDPDFGLSEYKKLQAEFTRKTQALSRWKALEPYRENLGGDEGIYNHLMELAKLKSNPQMAKMIEQFNSTGAVSTDGSNQGSDSMWDDDPDPRDQELQALKQEMQQLKSALNQTQGKFGSNQVTQMLDKLKGEFPDSYDIIEPAISEQVDKWRVTPEGRQTLANLDYSQLRNLAFIAMGNQLEKVGEKRYLRILEEKKGHTTDSGGKTITSGREPRAEENWSRLPLHEKLERMRREDPDWKPAE